MRNIKLTIQYDGSRYKGFSAQKDTDVAVEAKITDVLEKMTGEEIELIGCERMDVGSHAENYVANFKTECTLSEGIILEYLYEYLPEDIVVKNVEQMEERFHARYHVKSKTYRYTINCNAQRDVFNRKYVHHINWDFDLENMRQVAEIFKGTHDFQSFTSLKPNSKSTMKTINDIIITQDEGVIQITITADDFLLHMPRLIIGTIIEAGKRTVTPKTVQEVMDKRLKVAGSPIGKAKALSLVEVRY